MPLSIALTCFTYMHGPPGRLSAKCLSGNRCGLLVLVALAAFLVGHRNLRPSDPLQRSMKERGS